MKLIQTALLLGLFTAPTFAQVILFEDDFSDGMSKWAAQAPWHLAPDGDACTSLSAPPASFGPMARMGDPDCTFLSINLDQDGTWYEVYLDTAEPISIPLYADNPRLTYDSYIFTEGCNGWDYSWVSVSRDMGASWEVVGEDCLTLSWHSIDMDLSPWSGEDILIRFTFSALDVAYNDMLGWMIDNVKVSTDACTQENYCVAAPNTASPTGAIIGHTGSKRIHLNNFALTLTDGPPGQFAHFFFGPFETQMPVANGFLCVGTDAYGYRRLHPGGQIDASGYLEDPIDFTALTGSHTILPGMKLNFQCWYRDFENGVSTSNFSDARSITFCP